jgi:phosphoribosylanthranilate isomerase
MTKIKICGLRRPEDIAYVNEAKPDFAGFIIDVPKSRRNVPREKVWELTALLSPEILPVGVFVNAPMETILSLVTDGTLKAVQLHGQESQSYLEELKKQVAVPLIRAFSIRSPEDLTEAEKSPADFVLLDNGAGGTGETFDWSLLSSFDRPFFLAGGLRLENIAEAVSRFHPYALDLSSGVETDGYKDKEKIIAAVAAVRR